MRLCFHFSLLTILLINSIIPRKSLEQNQQHSHFIALDDYGKLNAETVLDEHIQRLTFQSKRLYNAKETLNSTENIGLHGKCANTIPVIVLETTAKESSVTPNSTSKEGLNHSFTPLDIKTNFSLSMQHHLGILRFKIFDVVYEKDLQVTVCYHGEYVKYSSARCLNEDKNSKTSRNHSYYNGGNGYDIRIVKTNRHAVLWNPVIDNRDGTYTVDIRIEHPGEYNVEVYQNNKNGCHFADCDCPHCDTVEFLASRMKMCSKVTNGPCVRLVASRKLRVIPATTDEKSVSAVLPAQNLLQCVLTSLGTAMILLVILLKRALSVESYT
jgi:hypothetical protein